jgi:hypothetical protein
MQTQPNNDGLRRLIHRIGHSATAMTLASYAITWGYFLLLLPLAVRVLSVPDQALWLALSLVTSFGQLADLGFRPTLVRAFAWACAKNGQQHTGESRDVVAATPDIYRLLNTAVRVYRVLFAVALLPSITVGFFVCRNIVQQTESIALSWASVAIAALTGSVAIAVGLWSGLLEGTDRVAEASRWNALLGVLRLVAGIYVIASGLGVAAFAATNLVIMLVAWVLMRHLAMRRISSLGGPRDIYPIWDREVIHYLWPPTWRSGSIRIGAFLIQQGSSVAVSQISDVRLISSYLLTLKVLTALLTFTQVTIVAKLPQLNHLRVLGKRTELLNLIIPKIRTSIVIAFCAIVATSLIGNPVLAMIGSKSSILTGGPYWALAIWLVLEIHHSLHATIYMTTNHVPFWVPSLISGSIIVGASVIATSRYGLWGIVLPRLVIQLLFNNWYSVFLNIRSLNITLGQYVKLLLGKRICSAGSRLLSYESA